MKQLISMLNIGRRIKIPDEGILAFRPFGEKARFMIEEIILQGPELTTYVLDFAGVRISETSFLDETLIELTYKCQKHEYGNKLVAACNLSDILLENLHSAIRLRQDKFQKKIPVVVFNNENKMKIIPELEKPFIEPSLLSTLDVIVKRGTITGAQIADYQAELETNNADMRLKRLYDYGFLFRWVETDDNGWHYVYKIIGA